LLFPVIHSRKITDERTRTRRGFTPEVAWVTQAGNTKLSEKLAVRPTSEAIMYASYSKWIRSWRDLPLRLNQWNNAVRWEFNNPVPFFRTREFLWNEGHTAFANEKEALAERDEIIGMYKEVCEEFLGLYGLEGKKTEKEKFAGAVFSEKIHYIMPNGKATEGPCFHHDGQKFAEAYDIKFLDKDENETLAWQNTFAISTRMLGVMFAVHSDDKGLILPPKMAPNQIAIIPIFFDKDKKEILEQAEKIKKELKDFSPILDDREEYRPGFKFNEYELKGIPLRIEFGSRDLAKKEVIVFRRDTGKKQSIKISELKKQVPEILEEIQKNLFEKSKKLFESKVKYAITLEEVKKRMKEKEISIAPLCKNEGCENLLKSETGGAKALLIDEKKKIKSEKCIICDKKADYYVYVAKTY
jgi:prolyl-tRNA synthetase